MTADKDYLSFLVTNTIRSFRVGVLWVLHIVSCNLRKWCISEDSTQGGDQENNTSCGLSVLNAQLNISSQNAGGKRYIS